MKSKRSPAPDSSMQSMNETCCETVDSDEKYTMAPNWQMELNRPRVRPESNDSNIQAAYEQGLVLRQKL